MLLSRNGTKTGWYMILAYDVTLSVRCSDACCTVDYIKNLSFSKIIILAAGILREFNFKNIFIYGKKLGDHLKLTKNFCGPLNIT